MARLTKVLLMRSRLILTALLCLLCGLEQARAQTGTAKPAELVRRSDGQVQAVGGRYALVVGIADYSQAGLPSLQFSERDAQAMRDTLVQYGGFPAQNVTLFLGPKATLQNILFYLDNLRNRPDVYPNADTFVLYFSGHGGVLDSRSSGPNSSGQRGQYLIPANGSNQAVLAENLNIALDKITQSLDDSPFRRKVLLLDACRNVLRIDGKGGEASAGFDLSQYSVAEGLRIMTGTKFGEISWEDEQLGHGVFTFYLLAGLRGAAGDRNHVVTASSLESYVSTGMAEYSRNNPDKAQTPQVSGEGLGGIVLTLPPPGNAPILPVYAQPTQRSALDPSSMAMSDFAAPPVARPPEIESWVIDTLELPSIGQDQRTVELAEAVLTQRGIRKWHTELPVKTWQSVADDLATQCRQSPTPLGYYLAAIAETSLGIALPRNNQAHEQAALSFAQEATRLAPDWKFSHYILGLAYQQVGRNTEAMKAYRTAINLDTAWAPAHTALGSVYDYLGQTEEAISAHLMAVMLDPLLGQAHNNLGAAYSRQERWQEALREYREAVRLDPNCPNAKENRDQLEDYFAGN